MLLMALGLVKRLVPKVWQHFVVNTLQTSGVPDVIYFLIRSVSITNVYRPYVLQKY